MLSGIWPRGSSSAPGSGNTGITSGRSPGPRYSALIGICGPGASLQNTSLARALTARPVSTFAEYALREQDRRQPLASIHGGLIGRPPRVEELHQLLSRGIVVPFAVALDELEQLIGGFSALARGIKRGRQIESRLMIERVCRDFLFQLAHRAKRLGLFGEIDRRLHGLDPRVIALRFRHHGQRLLGLLDGPGCN